MSMQKHILLSLSLIAMNVLASNSNSLEKNALLKQHETYRGHLAITEFKDTYPQIYIQNTSKNTQQSITQLYDLVYKGIEVNSFLMKLPQEKGIKEDIMHAIVPTPEFFHLNNEISFYSQTPVTIAQLAVFLAKKNNDQKKDCLKKNKGIPIIAGSLTIAGLAGTVTYLLGQSSSTIGQVALTGALVGGIGSYIGVKIEKQNLIKQTQQYSQNIQTFLQHKADFRNGHLQNYSDPHCQDQFSLKI